MSKNIIVAFDNWQSAEVAVKHAVRLAKPLSARVILLGIMSNPEGDHSREFVDPVLWSVTRSEFEAQLNQYVEYLKNQEIETEVELIKTPWIETLFHYADRAGSDLMIVPINDENQATVIPSILKYTHIPVLLARPNVVEPTFKNILVPLDGSRRAESSLNLAASIARSMDAHLHIAHVVQKPEMLRRTTLSTEDLAISQQLVQRNALEAKRYMNQIASRLADNVKTHVVIGNTVTTSLHNTILQYNIDLVILSAHGYSGEPQWNFGTIAENLIRYSKIPTIVVQDLPARTAKPHAEALRAPTGAAKEW